MKPEVKEKLIMFILGVVVGAVIASGCYAFSMYVNKGHERPKMEMTQEMKDFKNNSDFNKGNRPDRESRTDKGQDQNQSSKQL